MASLSDIPLILGIGNEFRRDDAAGIAAVRALSNILREGIDLHEMSGEGVALMDVWRGRSWVIVIDAVAGKRPGVIHRFQLPGSVVPFKFFHYSSHHFSVAEAIEMSRQLGTLPPRVDVFGIEATDFEYGTALSKEVETAVACVVDEICELIQTRVPR